MAIKIVNKQSHIVLFNTITGEFEREEITGARATGPDLLDISITNKCSLGCDICYKKSKPNGKHMNVDDYNMLIREAKDLGVVQIALGGGNPNEHPNFTEILKFTKNIGIVPNFTTNGYNLTNEHIVASKKYCGAVGLSLYDDTEHFKMVLDKFAKQGVRVNAHIVLQGGNVDQLIEKLNDIEDVTDQLNAIIFLNYKPINKRIHFTRLQESEFLNVYEKAIDIGFDKIGFDSCLASYVSKIQQQHRYTFCDSALHSAYISEELHISPCSFVASELALDLNQMTIEDAWNHKMFQEFVSREVNNECNSCNVLHLCKGGCKYFDINYCYTKLNEKTLENY